MSDKIILAHRSCIPSAILLRNSIIEIIGKKYLVYKDPPNKAREVILRYGNSLPVNIKDTEYNTRKFINLTSNKNEFSHLMRENKILSPIFQTGIPKEEEFPIMIRTTLASSGGRGILLAENLKDFISKYKKGYWTPFVDTSLEIRVHLFVVNGEPVVARIFKKIFNGEEESKFPIRTSANYHFSLREDHSKWKKAIQFSLSVGEVLMNTGGKFFTLDLGYCTENEKYIVFEANSGSGLNTVTASLYAEYLISQGVFG